MAIPTIYIDEIFEEAFERAGLEIRSGYDLRKARRCFNILTLEWANRGLNLWTIEQGTQAITAGDNTYSLDADTIDILEHVIRDSNNKDFTLTRIKLSEWAAKYDKNTTGQPSQIFVERKKTAVDLTLWPVPNANSTLVYWRLRGMDGLSAGNGASSTGDFPPRFIPAIVSGLAYHIAQSYGESASKVPFLQGEYERQFDLAAGEDRDRSSVRLVPGRWG